MAERERRTPLVLLVLGGLGALGLWLWSQRAEAGEVAPSLVPGGAGVPSTYLPSPITSMVPTPGEPMAPPAPAPLAVAPTTPTRSIVEGTTTVPTLVPATVTAAGGGPPVQVGPAVPTIVVAPSAVETVPTVTPAPPTVTAPLVTVETPPAPLPAMAAAGEVIGGITLEAPVERDAMPGEYAGFDTRWMRLQTWTPYRRMTPGEVIQYERRLGITTPATPTIAAPTTFTGKAQVGENFWGIILEAPVERDALLGEYGGPENTWWISSATGGNYRKLTFGEVLQYERVRGITPAPATIAAPTTFTGEAQVGENFWGIILEATVQRDALPGEYGGPENTWWISSATGGNYRKMTVNEVLQYERLHGITPAAPAPSDWPPPM